MINKGVIRKDGNRWVIDTKIKVDGEWKHLKKGGYETASEAKKDFEQVKSAFIEKHSISLKHDTFDNLFVEYEKMRAVNIDVSTLETDRGIYNNYFKEFIGKKINEVFIAPKIKKWFEELIKNNRITNGHKSKIITRMKDMLKFAYNHKYIDAGAYQDCDICLYQVKYTKKPQTERVVWTPEEELAFHNAIAVNRKDNLMFSLFLSCSARLGEFLALTPACIDFKNKKVHIRQQLKNIAGQGRVLTEKLKSHDSYRSVMLSDYILGELRIYIENNNLKENDFLFNISRNTFRRKLNHYCEDAGVRRINPHCSRHMMAVKLSKVATTGDLIVAAAGVLGHSPETFMNTYANHNNDTKQRELLSKIEA